MIRSQGPCVKQQSKISVVYGRREWKSKLPYMKNKHVEHYRCHENRTFSLELFDVPM